MSDLRRRGAAARNLCVSFVLSLVAGALFVPTVSAQDVQPVQPEECPAPEEGNNGNANGQGNGNGGGNGNGNNGNGNGNGGNVEEEECVTANFGFPTGPIVTPKIVSEHVKRSGVDDRLSTDGMDLMGDQIDNQTGSIVFSHTDINVPGNSHLPVQLIRRREQGLTYYPNTDVEFGDWQLDIPKIVVTVGMHTNQYAQATELPNWGPDRCTYDPGPKSLKIPAHLNPPGGGSWNFNNFILGADYSNGVRMHVPGQGSMLLLKSLSPLGGQWRVGTDKVSTSNWTVDCVDNGASDGEDSFEATAPNGDVYTFDHLVYRDATWIPVGPSNLARSHAILFATKIEDVHGNTIEFDFDSTHDRLNEIVEHPGGNQAVDRRKITFEYNETKATIISAAKINTGAEERKWEYDYDVNPGGYELVGVTLPDGREWAFDMFRMDWTPVPGRSCSLPSNGLITLTHPNGVTGDFTINEVKHGRTYVPNSWNKTVGFCVNENPTLYQSYFEAVSVTQKKLSGSDISDSIWKYTYEQDTGAFTTSGGKPDTTWTRVEDPMGHVTEYHHNRHAQSNLEGLLIKVERFDTTTSSTPDQEIDSTYVIEEEIGSSYLTWYENAGKMLRPRHTDVVSTARGSDVFTTDFDYDTSHGSTTYSYGSPTYELRTNNYELNVTPRTVETVYKTDKSKWILTLPEKIERNGKIFSEFSYDPFGRLEQHDAFEALLQKVGYTATTGDEDTVAWIEDALQRRTDFDNYHRGIPELVTRHDGSALDREVDDNGWITLESNWYLPPATPTYTEEYDYTDMGWLKEIDREDTSDTWSDTTISYVAAGSSVVQTTTRGPKKVTTTYDGFTRPVEVKTEATSDGGTTSYVVDTYDASGRSDESFSPDRSSSPTLRTITSYDSLDRVTGREVRKNTTLLASTSTAYLTEHKVQFTDEENATTIRQYYAYGSPDNAELYMIDQPEDTDTFIYRNDYGQPEEVRQEGSHNGYGVDFSQHYYYDDNLRVCRHSTPESGHTVYAYNVAGEMVEYEKGYSTGTNCPTASSIDMVQLTYDDVGKLEDTLFTDSGTPDIKRTYDHNDNPLTVLRDAAGAANDIQWTYSYDNANHLKSEELDVDSRDYDLSYEYNTHESLVERTLPSGTVIEYVPNGLGQAKQIQNASTSYITSALYHANGTFESGTYGNNFTRTTTWTDRQQPDLVKAVNGSTKAIELKYDYNDRGQVIDIDDIANTLNSRVYGYDGQGRLTSATGPWPWGGTTGSGTFKYDSVGNLREKVLGNRIVTASYGTSDNLPTQSTDTADTTRTIGHNDGRGNVTTLGGMTFVYDHSDQPTSQSGTVTATYQYDGNLKRVKQVIGSATIYSVYDATGAIVHRDDMSTPTDIVSIPGASLRLGNSSTEYVFGDHLGSVSTSTTSAGSVSWSERYTPFGEKLLDPVMNKDMPGFTSHIQDDATGLTYMQARYQDPVIGRFLSIDPVGFSPDRPDLFNRYSYVGNDPINLGDPDGRAAVAITFPDYRIGFFGLRIPNLGHAGVLLINDNTGYTRYYEFGRYQGTTGMVSNKGISNVQISGDGLPTQESLGLVLAQISARAGHGGRIEAAYFADADFVKMEAYASALEDLTSDQGGYGTWIPVLCTCNTFVQDVLEAGDVDTPAQVDPRPNSYIKELQGSSSATPVSYSSSGGFKGYYRVSGRLESQRIHRRNEERE